MSRFPSLPSGLTPIQQYGTKLHNILMVTGGFFYTLALYWPDDAPATLHVLSKALRELAPVPQDAEAVHIRCLGLAHHFDKLAHALGERDRKGAQKVLDILYDDITGLLTLVETIPVPE